MKTGLCFVARFGKKCGKGLVALSCLSVRPSVRLCPRDNSAPTGRIFMKYGPSVFSETLSMNLMFIGPCIIVIVEE